MISTASVHERSSFKDNKFLWVCSTAFTTVWISTLFGTPNYINWILENVLTVAFLSFLIISYRHFKFSNLSYLLIAVYLILHVYGAKYTYAENPFGYWLKDVLDLQRNHYDRIVHFSFGFLMSYTLRDIFINYFDWPRWVCRVLPCEITLSFSAMYELIEWSVADVFFPAQGDAYLGTQGDIWDAQKDMCLAFFGSILMMLMSAVIARLIKGKR